jgi:type III secretion protein L
MSGLIKEPHALASVGALPTASRRPPEAVVKAAAPDPRLAELEAEIARLEAMLVSQKKEAVRAIEAAKAEGRDAAVAADASRTALVERGLAEARAAWDKRLEELELLAVTLARAALAKMFGDSADLGELVTRTVAHHMAGLAADSVVGVRVSAADFSGDALDALSARIAIARTRLAIDPDLDAGGCRIDLKLGAIDIEPARQWAILDGALAAMERRT